MSKEALKKKIGPLPRWAWLAIAGTTLGLLLWYRSNSKASKQSQTPQNAQQQGNQVDPNNPLGLTYAQEQQDIAQGIDPQTGVPYSQEQNQAYPSSSGPGVVDHGSRNSTRQEDQLLHQILDDLNKKAKGHHHHHDHKGHHHHEHHHPRRTTKHHHTGTVVQVHRHH